MPGAKLAQHFLIDKNIAKKIVNAASLTPHDTVVEIGPGRGILTEFIVEAGVNKAICIELDRELFEFLKSKFKNYKNVKIVNTDFMTWELPKIGARAKRELASQPILKYISNLPYYLTSPILEKVLSSNNWQTAVFMLQKEVAERILAKPGTKEYGALTLLAQFYSSVDELFDVKRTCFHPEPKVEGKVLRFTKDGLSKSYREIQPEKFFKFVKRIFAYRRKTILNALQQAVNIEKEFASNTLQRLNIDSRLRPEDIEPEKFLLLSIDFKEKI
ncbi:MAG: 16S rRNA (adenine(1518)-N(6)/adenine(1519)-N(6))-dimethyltransferase RsmA [Elusimicrobiota bacterium]|nr:16S rRNA (adenine(1518)-N(6)/adenine(1519)-N(6))-dimethyltransferase RsmA [Elusimicrobiota bacterium]